MKHNKLSSSPHTTDIAVSKMNLERDAKEEALQTMIMQLSVGIVVFRGSEFIVEMVNDKYLELVDRSREQLTGKPLFKAIPELKGQQVETLLNDILRTGIPYYGNEFKAQLVREGKKEDAYFDFIYQPLKENDGSISGVTVIANEVTKSVVARHALAESERQFRNLVMQSPIAMTSVKGKDWIIDIANETLLHKIWQRKLEEVQGKKLLDVFPELKNQPFPLLLKQVAESGIAYRENEAVAYIKSVKGELEKYYLDFEYAPLFETDNKTVSGVIITVVDVTIQVEARKKVEENELYFRRMADNVPAMLFVSEKNALAAYRSRQWYKYTGQSINEAAGDGWLDAVHPDHRAETKVAIQQAIGLQKNFKVEYQLRREDGVYRWYEESGSINFDADGNAEGYSATIIDIHEKKLAEEVLKESRRALKIAIDSAELGTWDYNPATDSMEWDDRTKEMFGFTEGDFVTYERFLEGIHEDDKERVNKTVYKAIGGDNDGEYGIEYRITRFNDKKIRWIRAKGKAFFNAQHVVQRFLGIVHDITDQKNAILKIEDAEARLRLATEGTGIATWDLDLQTREIIYAPRLAELFGHTSNTIITHLQLREHIHPDDRKLIVEKAFEKAMLTSDYFYEARVVWPDQSVHWIRTHGKVIFDDKHVPLRMLGTMLDITAEKKNSLALQQSELRYRQLIHGLPVAFYTCDANGKIEIYNEAAVKLWGREPEVEDRWCGSFKIYNVEGEPMQVEECPMAMTIKTGKEIRDQEIIIERPDGTRVNVLPYPELVFNEKGEITGAINMLVDITYRKIAEQDMARLAAIVQSSEDAIISKTLAGIVTSWNPGAEKLLGYNPGEMIGESILKLIPEDRINEEELIINRIKKGLFVESFDTQRRAKDGRLIDISLTISPLKDNTGKIIGASKIARDVTIQKKLDKALRESELLFKTIANVSPVALWMTDKNGQNNFVNDTWIDWTGYSLEEQYRVGWLQAVFPEDIPQVRKDFSNAIASKLNFSSEFRIKRKDGETRWCLTEGYPYFNNKGEFEGYAGSVTDITERKMIEEELERKVNERTHELNIVNSALEKSNNELGEFAYVASHDLQEPLRKIKTFVSRLQESYNEKMGDQPALYMEKIVSAASRMSDLIRDLLEYSRTASISEKMVQTDLNEILENVKGDFELLIKQKDALIESDKLPVLQAVPYQMNQLFNNLISNSLKFSMEGRRPHITISSGDLTPAEKENYKLDLDQPYKKIILADNGIGFNNEFAEKVFEIFQRLNPRSTYTGSGIGLSICRKIAENHNGLISASSVENEGTTFSIILPIHPVGDERETNTKANSTQRTITKR